MPQALIIMGVSGSGKSTIAEHLAQHLNWQYFDADAYHPEANVKKMSAGQALNDSDRKPWLERLHELIQEVFKQDQSLTLACSALKQSYRDILKGDLDVQFVHLEGSFELIQERMQTRANHFMKADMLKSQFETLEPPTNALSVSIAEPPEEIVARIIRAIS